MGATGNLEDATEKEIIAGLLSGGLQKRKGEEQLFTAFSYFMREGIRKYSFTPDEAFDVYSDTILSAIEKVSSRSFEGRSSLKTYVYQIFHNKCVDLIRKKSTHKESVHHTVTITDMLSHISDAARSVIDRIIDRSDWDTLKAKLNELGGNCRQLLLLSADGYSDKEISLAMEYKTADVVKTSRLRCLEKLRRLYNENNN